ncbi:hypothetical protein Tco_1188558, partial [Tanacetum coccineum]
MSALKFADSHNMVAFLAKPTESEGSFWATAKEKTVNGEVQIQAQVDGKKVIVIKASVRRDLQLADENGIKCLPNATIFAELERMSALWPSAVYVLPQTEISTFPQVPGYKQVEEMSKHKEIYVTPSHTKKVFANMKRHGKDFSGEGSEIPTDSYHTPTITQPSTSKPQKKQSRRKQMKDTKDPQLSGPTEPVTDDTENVASVPTHFNDPLLSSVDKLKLTELSELEVEVEKVVSAAEVTTASATTTTIDELILAQTLIEIKVAKPKAVTTAAITATTAVTRPKARGVVVQEPSEFTTTTSSSQLSQLPQAKDKGKEKMVDPEKPLKKKDQILIDEEIAQRLQEELQAELEEEERLARQKEEEDNLISWDNTQAMMEA